MLSVSDWKECKRIVDAIPKDNWDSVYEMISNATGKMAQYLLHWCLTSSRLDCAKTFLKLLLRQPIDVNQLSEDGCTVLQTVVLSVPSQWSEEIARILLEAGARVDAQGSNSRVARPLVLTCLHDTFDIKELTRLFLEFGAAPMSKEEQNGILHSPFHRNLGFYKEYANLIGHALFAQRATTIALRKRGVHKDMIQLIGEHIWATRFDEKWDWIPQKRKK